MSFFVIKIAVQCCLSVRPVGPPFGPVNNNPNSRSQTTPRRQTRKIHNKSTTKITIGVPRGLPVERLVSPVNTAFIYTQKSNLPRKPNHTPLQPAKAIHPSQEKRIRPGTNNNTYMFDSKFGNLRLLWTPRLFTHKSPIWITTLSTKPHTVCCCKDSYTQHIINQSITKNRRLNNWTYKSGFQFPIFVILWTSRVHTKDQFGE
jgi:hypothetical protein